MFRMIGVKEKCWRVDKALYGLNVSPRSWSPSNPSRNKTLRQVEHLTPAINKQVNPECKAQDNDAHLVNEQSAVPESKKVSPEEFAASINK